jgi:hypothetical protein
MSTITLPTPIEKFVEANNAHDADALGAVFADGAVVRDDGKTFTTAAEVRGWIQSHLIEPKVVITPISFEGGRLIASSTADLPGGPWTFAYDFATEGDRISDMSIALA